MKPDKVIIRRQNTDISFSQAITIDRITGAATGSADPLKHDIMPSGNPGTVVVRVRQGAQRKDYSINRQGDLSY